MQRRGGARRDLAGPWRPGFPAATSPPRNNTPRANIEGNNNNNNHHHHHYHHFPAAAAMFAQGQGHGQRQGELEAQERLPILTQPQPHHQHQDRAQAQAQAQVPFNSPNYRGDLTNPRNRSADISDAENCGTWWTNLPANCTYAMLFDSMRHIGAVSHAVINPPVGIHGTSAAKVEFFSRASVDRLLDQAGTGHIRGHLRVGGHIPHIVTNRIRVAAHTRALPPSHEESGLGSRVLRVIGDGRIVRRAVLENLLAEPENRVVYGLETARVFPNYDGGRNPTGARYSCVEFRFASYAVQAARARGVFMAQRRRLGLSEEERRLWATVTCVYALA